MKILIVEPGQYPREAEIPSTLEAMQKVVQGSIEAVYAWPDAVLICNDEGLINGMELNRQINEHTVIGGPFFVCGKGKGDFCGLTEEQLKFYAKKLKNPQFFFRTNCGVKAYETTPEKYAAIMGKTPAKHKKPRSIDHER